MTLLSAMAAARMQVSQFQLGVEFQILLIITENTACALLCGVCIQG